MRPRPRGLLKAHELWQTRHANFADDDEGFRRDARVTGSVDRACVGRDLACHVVFAEERLSTGSGAIARGRCKSARQDQLGLGWANHDHHTFRSSREHFVDLMQCAGEARVRTARALLRRARRRAGARRFWSNPSKASWPSATWTWNRTKRRSIFRASRSAALADGSARSAFGSACTAKACLRRACIIWNAASTTTLLREQLAQ